MTRIASRAYLDGARGETCKLRIAGVCKDNRDTVVACHAHDANSGRSIKASDTSTIDGCFDCHEVFDRRAKHPDGGYLSEMDWLFYALRGIQETMTNRIERGILTLKLDIAKPISEKAAKPRKPKAARKPIPQPKNFIWPSGKIPKRAKK